MLTREKNSLDDESHAWDRTVPNGLSDLDRKRENRWYAIEGIMSTSQGRLRKMRVTSRRLHEEETFEKTDSLTFTWDKQCSFEEGRQSHDDDPLFLLIPKTLPWILVCFWQLSSWPETVTCDVLHTLIVFLLSLCSWNPSLLPCTCLLSWQIGCTECPKKSICETLEVWEDCFCLYFRRSCLYILATITPYLTWSGMCSVC